jgi:hypothetical protein
MLADATARALRGALPCDLAGWPIEALVAEAHAVAADAVRRAVLRARDDVAAVLTLKAGKAKAATAPARALAAAAVRALGLNLARIAGEPRLAHALAADAAAAVRAHGARRVCRAATWPRAVLPVPTGVAKAAAVGANALLRPPAVVGAFDGERAVGAKEAGIAVAATLRADAAAGAVEWPLAAEGDGTIGAVKPRPTVAATVLTHAVAVAVSRALPWLRAVDARPLEVARAAAAHAEAMVAALVDARGQLDRTVDAAVALLAKTVARQADSVVGAVSRAVDLLVARLATPARLADALAAPALAVPRAVAHTLEEIERAVATTKPRLTFALAAEAHAPSRAVVVAGGDC